MPMPALDLKGQTFGYLTVLQRAGSSVNSICKHARWLCLCTCGNQVIRDSQYLRTKWRTQPRNCGCHHGNTKHSMSRSHPYHIWAGMKRRCTQPFDKDWKNYGARGITVCDQWLASFNDFWKDMAEGYVYGLTLGRKNNNKGYSKKNCRWETQKEQANNTRKNRIIQTPQGRMNVTQAAALYNMEKGTLHARIFRYGWPVEKALTYPVKGQSTI